MKNLNLIMRFEALKKICHWGPLAALGIIKIITLVTIYCIVELQPPLQSPLAGAMFLLFISLSGSTLFHFISAIYQGPGFLPLQWMPENIHDTQYLQYCTVCQGLKAPRSHHCRKCNRCAMKMDHHCPWINNCVGHYNHAHFVAFLASAVGGCCMSSYVSISWILTIPSLRRYLPSMMVLIAVIFTIALSVCVVLTVGSLLYFQLSGILKNKTEIEEWITEKAQRRYKMENSNSHFVYPYSKDWLFNVKQVLTWNCVPKGNGIEWPVIEGCDQYTLTREQLAQKKEKQKRGRSYRVITEVSGSWFPIKYGCKVFCCPPFTDEPRIKLNVGDIVIVTRWRRHWLFGEKQQPDMAKRVKGWFPRPSVIEVLCQNDHYYYPSWEDQETTDEPNSSIPIPTNVTDTFKRRRKIYEPTIQENR